MHDDLIGEMQRRCPGKPGVGLEPTTPSLPWRAGGYDARRPRATHPACRLGFRPLRTGAMACPCGVAIGTFGSLPGHAEARWLESPQRLPAQIGGADRSRDVPSGPVTATDAGRESEHDRRTFQIPIGPVLLP